MAKQTGVWGIEIGQSALKALRCHKDGDQVVADAYEYIEYPKLLSQPEADPEALVAEALQQFLERNQTREYRVAISVPGQSGLAKFFKPPPVEMKKVPDIVRYEAKQQIPFDLNDVVWDYQMMPGSMVEEGYALESEIGLFAMKREQAYRWLKPFDNEDVEVDLVQLAPASLYNMVTYDRLHERVDAGVFEAENPPPSMVLLNLGTDATDLIVTNGFRIWQRSMPIGGNHFTRQLTKDLKLTFAKAEHLKRNARQAEDPKLVFQAMRPVFNDMVTEVQRSVGFFQQQNRAAKIESLLICGNAVKLPGLVAYLGKSLGYEVHTLDHFTRLQGPEVLQNPTFKDNLPTFGVCYGLCLQALGCGPMKSTLVPREILTERLIRAKKPWALAGVAALMFGMMGHYFFMQRNWSVVHENRWKQSTSAVDTTSQASTTAKTEDSNLEAKRNYLIKVGEEVAGNFQRRLLWPELFKAVNSLLPRHKDYPTGNYPFPSEFPYGKRPDIIIDQIETKFMTDVSADWFSKEKDRWKELMRNWHDLTGEPLPENFETDEGPKGEGWVVQLRCYHYFNEDRTNDGINHVYRSFYGKLMNGTVKLPVRRTDDTGRIVETEEELTMKQLGVGYPIVLKFDPIKEVKVPNPEYEPPAGAAGAAGGYGGYGGFGAGGEGEMSPSGDGASIGGSFGGAPAATGTAGADASKEPKIPPTVDAKRFDFVIQFCWQPTTVADRDKIREEMLKKQQEKEAAAAASGNVAMNTN